MSYIQEFEKELVKKLATEKDDDVLVEWLCEKMLESYRNGIKAGKDGAQVIRDGKSRRRSQARTDDAKPAVPEWDK